ncbi:hypothetical protein CY34DRAFT_806134 [Suillus luteus UH-Slu-Lm8-n1]|uniref:Uncharacterized protein n=1 Tax=Suillus luteus UH-Slu-Lm8-n1 TaxID=930992 RepID=A0A0C9ZU15_9AGAM|nr:hypothetical protein CY34DRAFT_806134 [Suillus luteus UH-Slu-Lm8-n1]
MPGLVDHNKQGVSTIPQFSITQPRRLFMHPRQVNAMFWPTFRTMTSITGLANAQ